MTSNNRKRAIRAYAAEHGVNYTTAMRALDQQRTERAAREAATYCGYCRTPLTTPTRCAACPEVTS